MFRPSSGMKFPDMRYYRLNYILLSSIGLWPYTNSSINQIQFTLSILIYISFISVQLLKLFISEYSFDLCLEVLSFCIMVILFAIKYVSFYAVMQNISKMPKFVRRDWSILNDDQEFDILHKYATIGKLLTIVIATSVYSGILLFILLQYVPSILDIVMPLNDSRINRLFLQTEYFIDQQKYFHLLAIHINVGLLLSATTGVATESFALATSLHCFGMFRIASYRMEHMLDEITTKLCDNFAKHIKFHGKIISGVDVHRKAIEFSNLLVDSFGVSYLAVFTIGLISSSINLFYLFRLLMLDQRIIEMYKAVIIIFFMVLYLIFGNYVGQEFMNSDYRVYRTICNTQWYDAPLKTQKLILFLIQKTTKTYKVDAGGMFSPCFEGLASTVSLILSTVTVFFSVQ